MNEVIREFLLETQENLAQLDVDLVTLEKDPKERETLARIFRTLHTIKGTAGFLGLLKLQAVTHSAENLLSRLTAGELVINAGIASALLATVDTIRKMLVTIERTEHEGEGDYSILIQTLEQLRNSDGRRTPNKSITIIPQLNPAPPKSAKLSPSAAASAPNPVMPAPVAPTPVAPAPAAPPSRAPLRATQIPVPPTHSVPLRAAPAPAPTPPAALAPAAVAPPSVAATPVVPIPPVHAPTARAPVAPAPVVPAPVPRAHVAPTPPSAPVYNPMTQIAVGSLFEVDEADLPGRNGTDNSDHSALTSAAALAPAPVTPPTSPPSPQRNDAPNYTLPEPAKQVAPAVSESSVRVDVSLLDKLMTMVGELVLTRNQILQHSSVLQDPGFLTMVQRLDAQTTELQAGVMKTRMQPIGTIWSKFPRLVRDLALACGKQVAFEMEGRDTELDKTIIEAIRDPMIHMVRNAVDHGLEAPAERTARGKPPEGRLFLQAYYEGGKVIIELVDDGGGIDPQRVRNRAIKSQLITAEQGAAMSKRELMNLIFLPGFSTADKVTHFSGRGVGMNVVRTNIEKIGGTVDVDSCVGLGTTIRIKIPLTLAIIPALIVRGAGDRYAIPQISLLELVRLEGEQVRKGVELIHGAPVFRLRGNLLPLVYLNAQLQVAPSQSEAPPHELNIVVLQADDRPFGLVVDEIHDTEEIVVKPLQKQLKKVNAFAGATIMGDGKVALILDILGLAQRAQVVSTTRERPVIDKQAVALESDEKRQTVLLCAATDERRMAFPLAQVARLEEFPRSALESVGNQYVVLYRDDILPLIDVLEVLQTARSIRNGAAHVSKGTMEPAAGSDAVQVVVHSWEGRHIGLIIGRILDVVEDAVLSPARVHQPCLVGTAVIQGRATQILDVQGLIQLADPTFYQQPEELAEEV